MSEQLSPLKRALLAIETLQARVRELEAQRAEPVAVIGIGCRMPGGVDSPATFARLLAERRDAIRPLPPAGRPGWPTGSGGDFPPAGYLELDPGAFDAELFGISPREAASIDPQQRIALECAWEALENGGIAPSSLKRSRTGVYIGITGSDYQQIQLRGGSEFIHAHFASGVGLSMASGRIAYLLGLQGPAVSLDTACSSALVAVHLACQSLRGRESDLALAGGTSLILATDLTVAFRESRMLSPDGRCKTFDARADGFGRGEGCGIVVLKRLSDALRDRDPIWAVIRGSAVNQDGPSSGLTAPNGPAQEAVIRAALDHAGLEPLDVGYVEAHGTGTELGDPIEVQALAAAYGGGRASTPLLIGTIKTNIGHLEGAAGAAGLIKAILAVHSGEIPPHLHFETPNPLIPWQELPVRVTTEPTAFPAAPDGKRRAGVSSFGFSGTNAHVIVEQPPTLPDAQAPVASRSHHVLPLAARTPSALRTLSGLYADALERDRVTLEDLCHTAAVGRAHLSERLAVVCASTAEAVSALRAHARGERALSRDVHAGRVPVDAPRPVFLFTGQGAQWPGMGRVLYDEEPVARAVLDRCDALLREASGISLLDAMFGRQETALERTRLAQPALFALEIALAELWRSWGVKPAMVIGHSVGEYAAAVVAGAISLEQGLRLIDTRARLMDALPAGGAMAAVAAAQETVAPLLAQAHGRAGLAAVNGPEAVVISGDEDAIASITQTLRRDGIESTPLRVSHAFHSHRLDPMLAELARAAADLSVAEPKIPLISNLTGKPLTAAELADPAYWARHARAPVLFHAALLHARSRGHDLFLECGPHPTLCGMGAQAIGDPEIRWVASLRRDQNDARQLGLAVASLYTAGIELDWHRRDCDRAGRRVRLPSYPFERDPLWARLPSAMTAQASPARRKAPHPLLAYRMVTPDKGWQWECPLTRSTLPFLADHVVHERVIVPAAAFIELAMAAAQAGPGWTHARLLDITIRAPLMLGDAPRAVQVRLGEPGTDGAFLSIYSVAEDEQTPTLHVEARVQPETGTAAPRLDLDALEARCPHTIDAAAFYAVLRERGLAFGPAFRGVRAARYGDGEAVGQIALPQAQTEEQARYRIHPALLDAGLQVTVAALRGRAEAQGTTPALYLPVTAERITFGTGSGVPCTSHVTLERADAKDAGTLIASLRMADARGETVVAVDRLVMKRADDRFGMGAGRRVESLYETVWVPEGDPVSGGITAALDVEAAARALDGEVPGLAAEPALVRYDRLYDDLHRLSTAYIVEGLAELGWQPLPGDEVRADQLLETLRVRPRHRRLLRRMLAILAEDGCVEPAADGYRVRALAAHTSARALADEMQVRYGADVPELEVTRRCGEHLARVLRGQDDPLAILFPGGDTSILSRLYRDTPVARGVNSLIRSAVEGVTRALPDGCRLRVLEIGGGTGGTTAHVLPVLPADRVEYTFTDIGPMFVARAAEEFGRRDGMRFKTLDIDLELSGQDFAAGEYDLVLASNVLHATKDLEATLTRVKQLLAPGGLLLAMEAVHPERWHDVTVGLLDGWWAFTDTALRPDYALLDRARWLSTLAALGFRAASTRSSASNDSIIARQAVLFAQKPAEAAAALPPEAGHWLVFADAGGVAEAMIRRLRAAGAEVSHCSVPPSAAGAPPDVQAAVRAAFEATARGAAVPTDVAYFWALDGRVGDSAPDGLEQALASWCAGALHVAQALAETGERPPRLHLVTRGAVAAQGPGEPVEPAQATLWGLARAVRAERPEIVVRVLDLPVEATPTTATFDRLFTRLVSLGPEVEFALRADACYVPRLYPRAVPELSGEREPRQLAFGARGVLDELAFVAHPRTAPTAGEIEIEIEAAGLNFRDVMHALGVQYVGTHLGGECVGVVTAVGPGVAHVRLGDRVLVAAGAFGDYVTLYADLAVKVPDGFSIAAAATVPIAFLTADYALSEIGRMQAGETVLIHAAAGGVGMAAVQLARAAGLRVLATAGSERKRALVRALGAEAVFDSRSLGFADDVLAATDGRGVDLVLNSLAGDFIPASLRTLATGGRLLELGKTGIWTQARVEQTSSLKRGIRYHIVDLSPQIERTPADIRPRLERLIQRFERGELQPLPHRIVSMSRAVEAFRDMAAGRHVGKLVLVRDRALPVRADGSYLITGGLAGLGLLVAERLAERGAGRLVLVGRSAPTPEAQRVIERLQAAGTAVDVVLADLGNTGELARVLSLPALAHQPLRGVVHSAGTLDDAMLPQQTWAHFRKVFAAKVVGSTALAEATAAAPLDFLVFFSSISAVFGSSGQINHSAANAYLDALACALTARGRPALSIAWGAWSGTGAAVRRGAVARVSQRGVLQIEPNAGIELFERLATTATGAVVVSPMDWPAFVAASSRHDPFIEHLTAGASARSNTRAAETSRAEATIAETVASAPPRRRIQVLRQGVERCVARILGLPAGRVPDGRQPLGEIGLDSLLAVELRNALAAEIGGTLPASLLFDHPNIDALVGHLATRLNLTAGTGDGARLAGRAASLVERPMPAADAESLDALDLIEGLSDAEVAQRVQGRVSADHD